MKRALAIMLAAGAVAAPASATEVTIVPGVGIGKIKLGMTQEEVEQVLGKDYRQLRGNRRQCPIPRTRLELRELVGCLSSQRLLLARHPGRDDAQPQKTARGIGVSSFRGVLGSYPQVFCGGVYSSWGSHATDRRDTSLILVNKSVYTAFAVKPSVWGEAKSVWRVYAVIVQQAIPGHITLPPASYRCAPGWRERGRP